MEQPPPVSAEPQSYAEPNVVPSDPRQAKSAEPSVPSEPEQQVSQIPEAEVPSIAKSQQESVPDPVTPVEKTEENTVKSPEVVPPVVESEKPAEAPMPSEAPYDPLEKPESAPPPDYPDFVGRSKLGESAKAALAALCAEKEFGWTYVDNEVISQMELLTEEFAVRACGEMVECLDRRIRSKRGYFLGVIRKYKARGSASSGKLSADVAEHLQRLKDSQGFQDSYLDERAADYLSELPPGDAIAALDQFMENEPQLMKNPPSFMMTVIKQMKNSRAPRGGLRDSRPRVRAEYEPRGREYEPRRTEYEPRGRGRPEDRYRKLSPVVSDELMRLFDTGHILPSDIDDRAIDFLSELPDDLGLQSLDKLVAANVRTLKNPSAYFMGVIREFSRASRGRAPPREDYGGRYPSRDQYAPPRGGYESRDPPPRPYESGYGSSQRFDRRDVYDRAAQPPPSPYEERQPADYGRPQYDRAPPSYTEPAPAPYDRGGDYSAPPSYGDSSPYSHSRREPTPSSRPGYDPPAVVDYAQRSQPQPAYGSYDRAADPPPPYDYGHSSSSRPADPYGAPRKRLGGGWSVDPGLRDDPQPPIKKRRVEYGRSPPAYSSPSGGGSSYRTHPGAPSALVEELDRIVESRILTGEDLSDRVMSQLVSVGAHNAISALREFASTTDFSRIRNRVGYLIGVLRKFGR